MSFSLEQIENQAKGKPVASIVVHYEGRKDPVRYPWVNRKQVKWDNVLRCRLDFETPVQHYVGNGEYGTRPGFRVKPKK